MKRIILSTALLCFLPLAWAGTTTQETDYTSKIIVDTRPEIMGLWSMEIPENKQCVEYYNFRNNNELIINSGAEWSYGQYVYQAPNNHIEALPVLAMRIQYDNNEPDCLGFQEDQSDEVQQIFIKWLDQHKIEFCTTEQGQECFATLNRKRP